MGYQSKALDILHRLIPIIVVSEKKIFFVILSYLYNFTIKLQTIIVVGLNELTYFLNHYRLKMQ